MESRLQGRNPTGRRVASCRWNAEGALKFNIGGLPNAPARYSRKNFHLKGHGWRSSPQWAKAMVGISMLRGVRRMRPDALMASQANGDNIRFVPRILHIPLRERVTHNQHHRRADASGEAMKEPDRRVLFVRCGWLSADFLLMVPARPRHESQRTKPTAIPGKEKISKRRTKSAKT